MTLFAAILLYRFTLRTSFGTHHASLENTTPQAPAAAVRNKASLSSLRINCSVSRIPKSPFNNHPHKQIYGAFGWHIESYLLDRDSLSGIPVVY